MSEQNLSDAQRDDLMARRVLLQLAGTDAVTVRRDVEYLATETGPLTMDLYYPPGAQNADGLPVVVIAAGYSDFLVPRYFPCTYKELGWTISMARLIAASGVVAVAYTNRDPARAIHAVCEHLEQHAQSLRVDGSRMGVWAVSGNVPTALSLLMRSAPRAATCAVVCCGYTLDLDGATDVAEAAARWRFANPGVGTSMGDLRPDIPMFVARAGRDQFPGVNESIDAFVSAAIDANLPITFVNHPDGPHAFDLFHDSATSRDIIRQALEFIQRHLLLSDPPGVR